jgi:hypothetical protein
LPAFVGLAKTFDSCGGRAAAYNDFNCNNLTRRPHRAVRYRK